jgi:enoyl-CoA hydratase/carnithine racemase
MGDDGTIDDSDGLLQDLNSLPCKPGRSHWAVTVLQAIEKFDAGPVWAFEQFAIDIDSPGLTKSTLYFGAVTQAAIAATLTAIQRIQMTENSLSAQDRTGARPFSPLLQPRLEYCQLSLGDSQVFQGGKAHHRPLLRAAERAFDVGYHDAQLISRRIRSSDSQPGVLTKIFGPALYVYGGMIEDNVRAVPPKTISTMRVGILGIRNNAICISTIDGKGVWITHTRRLKTRLDQALWPKLPAVMGLLALEALSQEEIDRLDWPLPEKFSPISYSSYQKISIDMQAHDDHSKIAYLYFNFYNGAMSTSQCSQLIEAMDYIISESTPESRVHAVVLMGGDYFSNGIALNVIEAAPCPATESWLNINRINDVVYHILYDFPARDIVTFAAIRGNAAAGGVALAAACDVVIAGTNVVLNPAYRAVGLFGSEYHTLSYPGRCAPAKAQEILTRMLPMDAQQAQAAGLVDFVFPGPGSKLDDSIRFHVDFMLRQGNFKRGLWRRKADLSKPALARARAVELKEMSLDFWSARSLRYHERRRAFVRKVQPKSTPLRFATHRRAHEPDKRDIEETDDFDNVDFYENSSELQPTEPLRDPGLIETTLASPSSAGGESYFNLPSGQAFHPPGTAPEEAGHLSPCYYEVPKENLPTPPSTPAVSRRSQMPSTMAAAMKERVAALKEKGISPFSSPFTPTREIGTFSFF